MIILYWFHDSELSHHSPSGILSIPSVVDARSAVLLIPTRNMIDESSIHDDSILTCNKGGLIDMGNEILEVLIKVAGS